MIIFSIFNPPSPTKAGTGPNSKRVMLTSSVQVWGVFASDGSSLPELLRVAPKPVASWLTNLRWVANITGEGYPYAHGHNTPAALLARVAGLRESREGNWYQGTITDTNPSPEKRVASVLLSVSVTKTKVRAVGQRTSPPEKATFFYLAMDQAMSGSRLNLHLEPYPAVRDIMLLEGRGFLLDKETAARFMPVTGPEAFGAMFGRVLDDTDDLVEFGILSASTGPVWLDQESIFVNPRSEEEKIVVVSSQPKRKRKLLLKKK